MGHPATQINLSRRHQKPISGHQLLDVQILVIVGQLMIIFPCQYNNYLYNLSQHRYSLLALAQPPTQHCALSSCCDPAGLAQRVCAFRHQLRPLLFLHHLCLEEIDARAAELIDLAALLFEGLHRVEASQSH